MDAITPLVCPSCGGKLEVKENQSVVRCTHCGNEHQINRQGTLTNLESYARCPVCQRNDKAEKVTSILRSHAEDSNLVINLSAPVRPTLESEPKIPPQPILLPKPEIPPKPTILPQPSLPPKPTFKIRKLNWALLIIGAVLILGGYVFLSIEIGMLIEKFTWLEFFFTLFFFGGPILLGIFLSMRGLHHTKATTINNDDLQILLQPINGANRKSRNLIILISSLTISGLCLLFSFLISKEESGGTLLPLFFLSLLPIIFASFIYFILKTKEIIKNSYFSTLEEYQLTLANWEERAQSIPQEWASNNAMLLADWEKNKKQIVENWEFQNNKNMIEWEQKRTNLLKKWHDKNALLIEDWENATARWNKLYYCQRDDVVFIPGEGTSAPIEATKSYLSN